MLALCFQRTTVVQLEEPKTATSASVQARRTSGARPVLCALSFHLMGTPAEVHRVEVVGVLDRYGSDCDTAAGSVIWAYRNTRLDAASQYLVGRLSRT